MPEQKPSKPVDRPDPQLAITLDTGIEIWKVHVDLTREQERNARVMSAERFKRLQANIATDNRLESMPLCTKQLNPAGNLQFPIISGHHRVRAARMANVTELYVMVLPEELTEDQIKSKQLAHNALNGEDDQQILKEIYDSIKDVEAKIATGVLADLNFEFSHVRSEEICLPIEFEVLNMTFLQNQMEDYNQVLELISRDARTVDVVEYQHFAKFKEIMRTVKKVDDIRSISAILVRMVEIVKKYYETVKAKVEAET